MKLTPFKHACHLVKDEGEDSEKHFLSLRKSVVYGKAAMDGGHVFSGRAARRLMKRKKYQRMMAKAAGGEA